MSTLADKPTEPVAAVRVFFVQDILDIVLNDGREIRLNLDKISWLDWLAQASQEQRTNWSLDPGGFAVY
ncbi:MAG: DUF2442 domain-containing protein [Candidatus Latescibacteria bacterium]|nr:DUF2442 domain-containing protein [Candidatus Latescibacterota bacterium]